MRSTRTGACSGSSIFVKKITTNAIAKIAKAIKSAGVASAILAFEASAMSAPIKM
ncbi:secreted protein [gut metagenome]|uniref:Secreted protein n=1 Tax=gut metagenome TaxID=749906 RepID=J9GKD0_9ZZZZ